MVSHELKTPITSLSGYVQMLDLKATRSGDKPILDITAKAKRQVERMRVLVSGFLDVARMNEGKIELNKKPFDMADLIKQAREESVATVASHQLTFEPVAYTPVEADQNKIEQVLINFINNAVKYSAPATEIIITCLTEGNMARVSVTDQGMGI